MARGKYTPALGMPQAGNRLKPAALASQSNASRMVPTAVQITLPREHIQEI